jgi:hypothetical protein
MVAALSVGCAAVDRQQSAEPKEDKEYVTGSRIPVRDHGSGSEVQGVNSKQGIDNMMRGTGATSAPPRGGN